MLMVKNLVESNKLTQCGHWDLKHAFSNECFPESVHPDFHMFEDE